MSDLMDFRPGDHRVVAARQKSTAGWVVLGLVLFALATGAWVYQFRPQWVARIYDLAGTSGTNTAGRSGAHISAQGEADGQFRALYQKYGMTPLGRGVAPDYKVSPLLASLQKEPCDKLTIFQASGALENVRAIRGAAEMLKGSADVCPDSNGELYHASELYYLLGDYDTAVKLSSDLINHQPDAQSPYFVRAKSEQGLKRYAAAAEDYATLIRLLPK
jgi:tetratricopeptide (TPR) repeat protein